MRLRIATGKQDTDTVFYLYCWEHRPPDERYELEMKFVEKGKAPVKVTIDQERYDILKEDHVPKFMEGGTFIRL